LRKKIATHKVSKAHLASEEIYNRQCTKSSDTEKMLEQGFDKYQSATEKVFRVAYFIANNNRPYSDLPKLIDCHVLNGVNMGVILHSDKSCQSIINSIAGDMRKKVCDEIISANSKFSVLVDESTSLSTQTCLVIHIRAVLSGKPTNLFLDLVELTNTDSKSIAQAITDCLNGNGFSESYCNRNLICFASDGASNMTGHKSGVGALLQVKYPDLVLWHCANHRLELSVGDTVKEVAGVNPFKIFMDSLYSLYHQSPKLQGELKQISEDLDSELSKLGRVLDTRWAASSLRSVQAVHKSYTALATHFSGEHSTNSAKFKGLFDTLTSPIFLANLAIMQDALTEISRLSQLLQNRDVTLVTAHKLIEQTIKSLENMIDNPGKFEREINLAVEKQEFKGIKLNSPSRVVQINRSQFFRSLANSVVSRMLTVQSRRGQRETEDVSNKAFYSALLKQITVLSSANWPAEYDDIASYGEADVEALCRQLHVDSELALQGFRFYKANGGRQQPASLTELNNAVDCLVVSTAECERAFSTMNEIITKKRNRLSINNVSSLMWINILGPPISTFNPKFYAQAWLKRGGHSASDRNSVKRKRPCPESYYNHLHLLLNK
jgi:hypothetical protein